MKVSTPRAKLELRRIFCCGRTTLESCRGKCLEFNQQHCLFGIAEDEDITRSTFKDSGKFKASNVKKDEDDTLYFVLIDGTWNNSAAMYRRMKLYVLEWEGLSPAKLDCQATYVRVYTVHFTILQSTPSTIWVWQELASQLYRFRTHRIKIETIVEADISTLGEPFVNEIFNEWKELASEEGGEEIKAADESENLEEIWIHMQESILSETVKIHIPLFGSTNLLILIPKSFCNNGIMIAIDAFLNSDKFILSDPYANVVGDAGLSFDTEAAAKDFAERHGLEYEVSL
ncbi:hypothetical protein SAY86_002495 [Trapa natans]|uniref:Uncharacterized protein n=1 Tax=Trapa natans TaxID=22666 RepID=A0AAN7R3E4_TRANT|nr:hypothetical protein SAY86_002495 [Trapa natans]